MDAFQNNDFPGSQAGGRRQVILFAGSEVKVGHEDLFPVQQAGEGVREQLQVQGVNGIIVLGAVQLEGHIIPVDEEVIHGDAPAGMAEHLQMDPQPAGKSGFAAGGGAGHQDDMLVLFMDFPGNIIDGSFMQGFIDPDEVAQLVVFDHAGEVRDIGDPQDLAPLRALGEDFQVLGPVDIGRGVIEVRAGGELKHETAPELKHGKDLHIARGDGHGAIEIFPHAIDAVHIEIGGGAVLQQRHLVLHLFLFKITDGIIPGPAFFFEHQVQVCQAPHLVFDADDILAV